MGALTQLKHAWNAFRDTESDQQLQAWNTSVSYGATRPDRIRSFSASNERSMLASIYTTMAIDFASVLIRHVKLDDDDRYVEDVKSALNNCLKVEANIDQDARAFLQDIAMTLFEKGTIAVVPIDTTFDPNVTGGYDIQTMRVGHICDWRPRQVKVSVYNDVKGKREELWLDKSYVAVVENPLYMIMNEPNSILQRLIRKLNLLDTIDEQSGSGKLDIIIQLPYVVKSETKRQQANQRRQDIEDQLKGSRYGIAYTDGTEKITQLNRASENNLMAQIEYLFAMLYTQLGLTPEIMNGTADEKAMLNYYGRTINPLLDSVVGNMRRTFLTKTARTQGQSLVYYRNPFALVSISDMADIADKFSRNEILSPNEIRSAIGFKPSKDPKADQLRNSNMPQQDSGTPAIDIGNVKATPIVETPVPKQITSSVGAGKSETPTGRR